MQGKVFICSAQYQYKVFFENLDLFLINITSVVMGWHELVFHTFFNCLFEFLLALAIQKMQFWLYAFSLQPIDQFWYNLIISLTVLFLVGSLKMLLLSSSNSTIIYLFPQNDVTGNSPVWSKCILRSNLLCKLYSLTYTTFTFFFA